MAIFQLGAIIRYRREQLGISQEELADGICSVPTLSRIENGERMPTKNHYEMLMQRLGYSDMSMDFFANKKAFQLHELKTRLRFAYMSNDFPLAKTYLEEFDRLLDDPTKIDEQFSVLYHTLLPKEPYPQNVLRERFEYALKLTCPTYSSSHIPHVLSYEEIILLNNIAICCNFDHDSKTAISILYALKEYYEHNMICTDEALRTQPMILYNLSKYLGLEKRYDECIEICDIGIQIARRTGRYSLLGETMYNRSWALLRRNRAGDADDAKKTLRQAIAFSDAIDNQQNVAHMKKLYLEHFGDI